MENVDLSMIRRKLNFIFCNQFNGQTKNQTKLSLSPFSKIGNLKNEFQTPFWPFLQISSHTYHLRFYKNFNSFFRAFVWCIITFILLFIYLFIDLLIYWFIDLLFSSIAAIQSIYIALMVFVMYILLSTIIFNYLFIY